MLADLQMLHNSSDTILLKLGFDNTSLVCFIPSTKSSISDKSENQLGFICKSSSGFELFNLIVQVLLGLNNLI